MKAIVYAQYGPPEVLRLEEVPKPTPRDDEVLIKTCAATVIIGDCELRSFTFLLWFWLPLRIYTGLLRPTRVRILGQELAGEIEAVGKDVTEFIKGDQVFAATGPGFGAYAEYICVPVSCAIAKKPAGMDYGEAATLPTGGLNALHYLRKGEIRSGEKILINGAAGNIGAFAVQLARYFGAEVTAVDSTDKLDMLRSIGADHVIDYTRMDFTNNGEIYDIIFDVVGKSSYSRCLGSLNKTGRYILANPKVWQMLRGLWTSLTGSRKVLFEFSSYRSEDLEFLGQLVDGGKMKSVIDKRYPFEETAEAHRYVESGRKVGNVVIEVQGSLS